MGAPRVPIQLRLCGLKAADVTDKRVPEVINRAKQQDWYPAQTAQVRATPNKPTPNLWAVPEINRATAQVMKRILFMQAQHAVHPIDDANSS